MAAAIVVVIAGAARLAGDLTGTGSVVTGTGSELASASGVSVESSASSETSTGSTTSSGSSAASSILSEAASESSIATSSDTSSESVSSESVASSVASISAESSDSSSSSSSEERIVAFPVAKGMLPSGTHPTFWMGKVARTDSDDFAGKIRIEAKDANGRSFDADASVIDSGTGYLVQATFGDTVVPGTYDVTVSVSAGRGGILEYVLGSEETVLWEGRLPIGRLIVNTDKETYGPGQDVFAQVTFLDADGDALCGKTVEAALRDATGKVVERLTTKDDTVESLGHCAFRATDAKPDYRFAFKTPAVGTYTLTVAATDGGEQVVSGTDFVVDGIAPLFSVKRQGMTRGVSGKKDEMQLIAYSQQTVIGELQDIVPAGFDVTDVSSGGSIDIIGNVTYVRWNKMFEGGIATAVQYSYVKKTDTTTVDPFGPVTLKGNLERAAIEETASSSEASSMSSEEIINVTSSAARSSNDENAVLAPLEQANSEAASEDSSESSVSPSVDEDDTSSGSGLLGSLFSFLGSIVTLNEQDLAVSFTHERTWDLVTVPAAKDRKETAKSDLMLEPMNEDVVPQTQGAAFTLLHATIEDSALDSEGNLKESEALRAIVQATSDASDIERVLIGKAIEESSVAIATAVSNDSVAVSELQPILEGGSARRQTEAAHDAVRTALTENDGTKEEIAALLQDELAPILSSVVTDEVVDQAIQDALDGKGNTVLALVQAENPDAIKEISAAIDDTIEGKETEIAKTIAESEETSRSARSDNKEVLAVTLTKKDGTVFQPDYHFERGSVVLVIEPERAFAPGMYVLTVTVTNPLTGETQTLTQDFAWGVLAMNPEQDTYAPGQEVKMALGVLNDGGHIVCNAELTLNVESPSGNTETLTIANEGITKTGDCGKKDSMSVSPDYITSFKTEEAGTYRMTLTAVTENGERTMETELTVTDSAPFVITRTAATRLYPFGESPMTLSVRFNRDYTGTITERVPASFGLSGVSPAGTVETDGEDKTITWTGNWNAGDTVTLSYIYDAPDVSPQFYLAGPVAFGDAYNEGRAWQIANDAGTPIYWIGTNTVGTGDNWSDTSKWSTSATGSSCSCTPDTSQIATFTSSRVGKANMNSAVSVGGINMQAGYTGTITGTSGADIFSDGWTIAGGTFTGSSNSIILNNAGSAFNQTGGTFTAPSGILRIDGGFSRTGGTFNHNNGEQWIGYETYNFAGGNTRFYNLLFRGQCSGGAKTITITSGFTASGTLTFNSCLAGNSANIIGSGSPTITVEGATTISQSTTNATTIGSSTGGANITLALQGNLTMSAANAVLRANVTFLSGGSINQSAGTVGTGTWTVNHSGITSLTAFASPQNMTVTAGTFSLAGVNYSATASVANGATLRLQGGETVSTPTLSAGSIVEYVGSSTYSSLAAGNSYKNLTFNGAGTWTLGATLDVDETLTLSAGTLNASSRLVTVGGNFIKKNAATFTASTSTVALDGTSQTLSGTTTFNNLRKKVTSGDTLTFYAGYTTTVSGTWSMSGATSNLLSLRSSTNGTQWTINPTAYKLSYVDAKDSNNTGSEIVASSAGMTNGGNNTNWSFPLAWVGGTGTNCSTAANWSSGSAPSSSSEILIDSTSDSISWDGSCAATVSSFKVGTSFNGTVTLARSLTVTNALTMSGGTFAQSSQTLTMGGYTQDGGTFTGGNASIALNGNYNQSGGTFTSTSGTMTILNNAGTFTQSAGTFAHNSGTVYFQDGSGSAGSFSVDVATTLTFNNLVFYPKDGGRSLTIASGDTLVTLGTFTQMNGTIDTGTIEARGNVVLNAANTDTMGTGTISFLTTGDQTITGNGGSTSNLLVNKSSGTLSAGSTNLYVASLTISGGTFASTSGTLIVCGGFTHTAGGTFTHNSGTVQFGSFGTNCGTGATIDVSTSETFYNLTFSTKDSGRTMTIASGDTLIVNNTFTNTASTINTGTIEAKGNVVIGANSGGGTAALTFSGTNNQTYTDGGTDLGGTVTINKASGTVTPAQNLSWNTSGQDLTITSGTLDLAGYNLTVNDVLTVNGGTLTQGTGTITTATYTQSSGTFTGGSGNITVNGTYTLSGGTFTSTSETFQIGTNTTGANWTHTSGGTFSHNNGTVKYQGINSTWDVSTSETFYNLNLSCGNDGNCSGSHTLTIATGDTLIVANTFTHTDGAINTGTIEARGNVSIVSTADSGTAILSFLVGGDQTITGNGGFTMNLSVAKSSGTLSAGSTDLTVKSFSLSSGTFTSTSGTFQIGNNSQDADWTHTSGGTFNHNNGTVKYLGAKSGGGVGGVWNVATSETFYNLTLSCGSDGNCGGSHTMTISTGDTLLATNTFTHSNGAINTGTVEAQGNVIIGANASGGSAALTFSGTANQTFTDNGGTKPTGTVTINKTAGIVTLAQNTSWNSSGQDLALTSGTLNLAGYNLTVNDDFTIGAAATLQLRGSETITGGPDTVTSGSTVTFTGDGDAASDTYTITSYLSGSFKNLTINSTDGATDTFQLGAALTVAGNLTLAAGTFDASASNYQINVAGNWVRSGGTFTPRSGTVNLNGTSQSITGSTTFYTLRKGVTSTDTLTFAAGTTQTVTNRLSLSGATSNLLKLRSSLTGTQWNIDPQSTRAVGYLNVKDSNNTNASAIDCATGCAGLGNNTNWTIPGAIVGVVYSDEGVTGLSSATIGLSLDGGSATSATSDSNGEYVFTDVSYVSGTVITLFINGNGTTNNAVTVTTGADTNLSDVKLYKNQFIVRSEVTSANLATAKTSNSSDSDITQIYSMSSNNATVATGKKMYIWTGATLTLGGTLTVGSTGTSTTTELHLDGSLVQGNNIISVQGPFTQSGGTFTGSSGGSAVTIATAFSMDGGTFTSTNGTLLLGQMGTDNSNRNGNWVHTTSGTFNHNNGTVQWSGGSWGGNGTWDVATSETFYNLTIDCHGTGACNSGHTLTIASGDTIIVTNSFTHTDGGIMTGTIEVRGDVVVGSGADGGSATIAFTGTADQSITSSGGQTASLDINKPSGTVNAGSGNLGINNFTLASGTFVSTSGILTLGQNGTDPWYSGNWTHTAGGTFSHNNGTVKWAGGGWGLPGTWNVATSETFYNLIVDCNGDTACGAGASTTVTISSGDTLVVAGNFTHTDGVIATGTIEAQGDVTIASGADGGTASVTFSGSNNQTYTDGGTEPTGTVTINKTGGQVTLAQDTSWNASGQDLALTAGTLNLNGYNLTVNDQFAIGSSGILKLFGSETITGGPDSISSGSTTIFTGDGDGAADTFDPTDYFSGSFKKLTFAATDGATDTFELGGTLTVPEALIISGSSVLSLNGNSLVNTSGTFANYGTLKLQGGESLTNVTNDTSHENTVIYTGSSNYVNLLLGNTYHNLGFDGTGSWSPAGALTINGDLTLSDGTLVAPSAITVTGDWENEGGTLTPGTSTVNLTGTNQTMSGSTTFYNLRKKVTAADTLTFIAGDTTTVSNHLSMSGATANRLSLRSSSPGTRWIIEPQGTHAIGYLDVQDSNNTDDTNLSCILDCVNSGNNVGWIFPITGIVYTDAGSTVIGAGKTIALSVNGATPTTATTESDGSFVINPSSLEDGDALLVYIDDATENGALITLADDSSLSGYNVYQNYLILRNDEGSSVTNADIATATDYPDSDIAAIVSATGTTLAMAGDTTLYVPATYTYAPGGTVSADNMKIDGTFTMGSNDVSVGGDWDSGDGTFTGTNEVTFTGGGTIEKGSSDFEDIILDSTTPVSHWKFDETSGTTAFDSEDQGNDGAHTNGPTISTDVAPTSFANARSLSFDGVDDKVLMEGTSANAKDVTIAMWIKVTSNGQQQGLYGWGPQAGCNPSGQAFEVTPSLQLYWFVGCGASAASSVSISENTWTHVALTVDALGNATLYKNGTSVGNGSIGGTAVLPGNDLIGQRWSGGGTGDPFNGKIDDVRVYNRALSLSEISDLAAGNNSNSVWTQSGALTTTDDLTITNGTLNTNGSTLTINGTYSNNGTLAIKGTELHDLTQDTDSGTTEFYGTGTHTDFSGLTAFNNLTLTGGGTWSLPGATTINGDLLIADSTLTQNSHAMTVGGDWTDDGGTFTSSADVTFTGTGTITETNRFQNVTINAANKIVTTDDDLTLSGSLVLRNGMLKVGDSDPTVTVEGTWENELGNFNAGSGTVVLSGTDQTMSGSTAFYNLHKHVPLAATLTFNRGTTQSVRGTWTAKGSLGESLRLRSSATGQQWRINPAQYDLQYIDVRDSNNVSGNTILASNDAVNSGNNTDWAFPISVTVRDAAGNLVGAGVEVKMSVGSGGTIVTSTTNGSGVATFNDGDDDHTVAGVASGALLTIMAEGGATVTRTNGTTLGFTVREDTLSLTHQVGSSITNADLADAATGLSDELDSLYTMSGTMLIGAGGKTLRIDSGATYKPGGDVEADDFRIAGTFAMENNEVTVNGSWDATGGTFSGTNTVIFTSQETETITVNTSAFHNVIFVVGNDPNRAIGKWTTTDNFNVTGSQTVQNTTEVDTTAPTINEVNVDPIYDELALVTWDTNESSNSVVRYGTSAGSLTSIASGSGTGLSHAVALQDLEPETTYYFRVYSSDRSNNTATGSVMSFTTIPALSTEEEVEAREEIARLAGYAEGLADAPTDAGGDDDEPVRQSGGGGGGSARSKCGIQPLSITNLRWSNSKEGATTVTWDTNYEALTIAQYGIDAAGEKMAGSVTQYAKEHSATLTGLKPGTEYKLRALSIDKCGTVVESEDTTFTSDTDISDDLLDDITHEAADGKSIVEKALQLLQSVTQTMSVTDMKKTLLAQTETIRDLAGAIPGPLLAGEPKVTVTDSSATISWSSDEESSSLVAYSPDDKHVEGTYQATVGNPDASTTAHQVTLVELQSGKTYHFQVKSRTAIGTETVSGDYTFTTLQQTPEVKTYSIDTVSPSSASVSWQSSVITDGRVTFTPYSGGRLSAADAVTKYTGDMAYAHKVATNELESGTVYQVEISGKTAGGVTVSKIIPSYATSAQSLAPQLAEIQTDASLSPGKETRIQVIVSWKTDKRGTSKVRYQKGVSTEEGAALAEETPTDESKSTKHAVILANLEPGTVYSFQVESGDDQGHVTTSKIFTILTPKKQESVFQVITSEFGKAFGWLGDL